MDVVTSDAIRIGAKAVWFQEGVRDDTKRAHQAGLLVVMDCCWLKEQVKGGRHLFSGMKREPDPIRKNYEAASKGLNAGSAAMTPFKVSFFSKYSQDV